MARLQKLEKILFYVFLFLIPFQIRVFLNWGGNEWNSVFLYLGDLLFVLIFILGFLRKGIKFKKADLFLLIFLIIAGVSLLVSSNLEIGLFRFIKLLEFILLYIYIRGNTGFLRIKNIFLVLIASGVVQSVLAITQFFKQSSLGLKLIEAGIFKPGAPGVATFIMEGGEKIMRAYGSFPHPNVLAGFLLLAIFCLYALWLKKKPKLRVTDYGLLIIGYGLLVFALFLTFSRGPILVFLMISMIFFLVRFFQLRRLEHAEERLLTGKRLSAVVLIFVLFCLISVIILSPYIKARFFTISLQEEAIDLRFFYNKMAISMIKDRPILGIGIGNFVNYSENYPVFLRAANSMLNSGGQGDVKIPDWLYQPVHNIYLLIGAEMGAIGLAIFILLILLVIIDNLSLIKNPFFFLFIAFLILAFADHYFWTLHSGGIIFWLSLAMSQDNL